MNKTLGILAVVLLALMCLEAKAIKVVGTKDIPVAGLSREVQDYVNNADLAKLTQALNGKFLNLSADKGLAQKEFLATMMRLIQIGEAQKDSVDFWEIILGNAAKPKEPVTQADVEHRVLAYIFTTMGAVMPDYFKDQTLRTMGFVRYVTQKIQADDATLVQPLIYPHLKALLPRFTEAYITYILKTARFYASEDAYKVEYLSLPVAYQEAQTITVLFEGMKGVYEHHQEDWDEDEEITFDAAKFKELAVKYKRGTGTLKVYGNAGNPLARALRARRGTLRGPQEHTEDDAAHKFFSTPAKGVVKGAVGRAEQVLIGELFNVDRAGHLVSNTYMVDFVVNQLFLTAKVSAKTVGVKQKDAQLAAEIRRELDLAKTKVPLRKDLITRMKSVSDGRFSGIRKKYILESIGDNPLPPGASPIVARRFAPKANQVDFEMQVWTYSNADSTLGVKMDGPRLAFKKTRATVSKVYGRGRRDVTNAVVGDFKNAITTFGAVIAEVDEPSKMDARRAYYLFIPITRAEETTKDKISKITDAAIRDPFREEVRVMESTQVNGAVLLFHKGLGGVRPFAGIKAALEAKMHEKFLAG